MSICPQCQAQNEDHYKFCLACGNELEAVSKAPVDDDGAASLTEKPSSKLKRPDLKARLDALRGNREGSSKAGENKDASPAKSTEAMSGWTSPPVGASLVSAKPVADDVLSAETAAAGKMTSVMSDETAASAVEESSSVESSNTPADVPASINEEVEENPQVEDPEPALDQAGSLVDVPEDNDLASRDDQDEFQASNSDHGSPDLGTPTDSKEDAEASIDADDSAQSEPGKVGDDPRPFADESLPADSVGYPGPGSLSTVVSDPPGEHADVASRMGGEVDTQGQGSTHSFTAGISKMRTTNQVVDDKAEDPGATRPAMERIDLESSGAHDITSSLIRPKTEEAEDNRPTAVSPMLMDEEGNICGRCGTHQPVNFKFCGDCGAKIDGQALAVDEPVKAVSIGQMVLIHADGSEGEHFDLGDGNLVIGRSHANELFSNDPYLSPEHVRLSLRDGWMTMDDLGSQNGVYIRLQGEIKLVDGDQFRIGQQLIRFEALRGQLAEVAPDEAGTHFLGSPTSGLWGKLVRVLNASSDLCEWTLRTPEVYLGRDRGTITLPEDVFVSGSHCRLKRDGDNARISDLGSTNGTYLRIKEATALSSGDLVLLGQQLFRFDLN